AHDDSGTLASAPALSSDCQQSFGAFVSRVTSHAFARKFVNTNGRRITSRLALLSTRRARTLRRAAGAATARSLARTDHGPMGASGFDITRVAQRVGGQVSSGPLVRARHGHEFWRADFR